MCSHGILKHTGCHRYLFLFRCHSAWRPSCVAAPKRGAVHLPSNLWVFRIRCRSQWILLVLATARQSLKPTALCVAMATGPMSVACVSVIPVVWAHNVSVRWRTTIRLMMPTVSRSQRVQPAVEGVTVCVDSAPAMQTSLVRCGANTANVTTSTACASKANCVPVSIYTYLQGCFNIQFWQHSYKSKLTWLLWWTGGEIGS